MGEYDERNSDNAEEVYKIMLIDQVKKIASLGSTDKHEGFYKMTIPAPGVTAVRSGYYDDSWNAYENAVNTFYDMLKYKLDKPSLEKMSKLDKMVKQIREKFDKGEIKKDKAKEAVFVISRRKFEALNSFIGKTGWLTSQSRADI